VSISSDVTRNEYTGNGVADTFAITFNFFNSEDLEVTRRNLDGTEDVLEEGADYDVVDTDVVLSAPLASGLKLIILRDLDFVQTDEISNQGDLYLDTLEDLFDRQVMYVQQVNEKVLRAVSLPKSLSPETFNPQLPSVLPANSSIVVNPDGDGFVAGPTADEISNAQSYAQAADASADAADASADAAAASAQAAADSTAAGARVVIGSGSAPIDVVAANGIPFTEVADDTVIYVQGSGGAVVVSAAARIQAGSRESQRLTLRGANNVQYVDLQDGNGLETGGQTIRLGQHSVAVFLFDVQNNVWVLESYNGIMP
jgi:hypothetical protein